MQTCRHEVRQGQYSWTVQSYVALGQQLLPGPRLLSSDTCAVTAVDVCSLLTHILDARILRLHSRYDSARWGPGAKWQQMGSTQRSVSVHQEPCRLRTRLRSFFALLIV